MENVLLASLFILGIYAATLPGMILEKPRDYVSGTINALAIALFLLSYHVVTGALRRPRTVEGARKWETRAEQVVYMLEKPLYNCIICMASVWGLFYLCVIDGQPLDFYTIITIIQVAGVNTVIDKFINNEN